MTDGAFFTEMLSHVSLQVHTLRHGLRSAMDFEQPMILHSQALKSVRERLGDPVLGVTDGIIGTVLAFASFAVSKSYSRTRTRY